MWLVVLNRGLGNSAMNTMAAAKLVMAYTGQWAHRMAHSKRSDVPIWVRGAQAGGLLVSPVLHKAHHTTYDDGFPILSGVTAPLVALLNKAVPNRHVWLAAFAFLSLADVWFFTHVCSRLLAAAAGA